MKILFFGSSGMLGNTLVRYFSNLNRFKVFATARNSNSIKNLNIGESCQFILGVDGENQEHLSRAFAISSPDIVVNCIGVVKQVPDSKDAIKSIVINSLLPHRLARLSDIYGSRLIHFSTDCVFSGQNGGYVESDVPDGNDLYGRSKLVGEVCYPHAITLRTSLIGHELNSARSLISWFLNQKEEVKGFNKAKFSGLPTIEIANIIKKFVIPKPELNGLYHLSADPINKHDLLVLVRELYGKKIDIIPDETLVIDRSLNSRAFQRATGFSPKPWPNLIQNMRSFR